MDHKEINGADSAMRMEASPPSVSIYDGIKGTIVFAVEGFAVVEVYEAAASRTIEFTSNCFYKDGKTVVDDLCNILGKGDEVMVDYMVGWTGCEEIIYSGLVWQGRKPQHVPQLNVEEFKKALSREDLAGVVEAGFGNYEGYHLTFGRRQQAEMGQVQEAPMLLEQCCAQAAAIPVVDPEDADGGEEEEYAAPFDEEALEWLADKIIERLEGLLQKELNEALERVMQGNKNKIVYREVGTQTEDDSHAGHR